MGRLTDWSDRVVRETKERRELDAKEERESKAEAHASSTKVGGKISSTVFRWNLPAVVTALATLTFAATALREWAYYRVIGEEFIALSSPSDYTSSVIRWLPEFILLCTGGVFLSMLAARLEGFKSREEIVRRSLFPRFAKFAIAADRHIIVLGLTFIGLWHVVRVDNPAFVDWLIAAMGCWIALSAWFVRHPVVSARLSIIGRLGLQAGPVVAAMIFLTGHWEAEGDLALSTGEYRIVHATGEVEDNVQLLRTTSKGILFLQLPARNVSFLTYSSFVRIDRVDSSQ